MQNVLLISRAIVRNNEGKVLFVQRSLDDLFDGGLWELPGGKLDEGELVIDGLKREVLEESGCIVNIDPTPIKIIDEYINHPKYQGYLGLNLIFNAKEILKSDDIPEYKTKWIDKSEYELNKSEYTNKVAQLIDVIFGF